MKLISWNVAGKIGKSEAQADALAAFAPDLVALQEVRPGAADKLRLLLPKIGLGNVLDTKSRRHPERQHRGVLIASRWPIEELPQQIPVPFRERSLSVRVGAPMKPMELHTVHVPPGSGNGWIKIETLEAVFDALSQPSKLPRILCGDFNSPQAETSNGVVITWGQRIRSDGTVTIGAKRGRRWDTGERNVIVGLSSHGFVDVFRHLNGYTANDTSWRQKWRHLPGYRPDHIFASAELHPTACRYLHALREQGLSDHSPIEAEFSGV